MQTMGNIHESLKGQYRVTKLSMPNKHPGEYSVVMERGEARGVSVSVMEKSGTQVIVHATIDGISYKAAQAVTIYLQEHHDVSSESLAELLKEGGALFLQIHGQTRSEISQRLMSKHDLN